MNSVCVGDWTANSGIFSFLFASVTDLLCLILIQHQDRKTFSQSLYCQTKFEAAHITQMHSIVILVINHRTAFNGDKGKTRNKRDLARCVYHMWITVSTS